MGYQRKRARSKSSTDGDADDGLTLDAVLGLTGSSPGLSRSTCSSSMNEMVYGGDGLSTTSATSAQRLRRSTVRKQRNSAAATRRRFTQCQLDFGQADSAQIGVFCPHCHLLYSSHEEDKEFHERHCTAKEHQHDEELEKVMKRNADTIEAALPVEQRISRFFILPKACGLNYSDFPMPDATRGGDAFSTTRRAAQTLKKLTEDVVKKRSSAGSKALYRCDCTPSPCGGGSAVDYSPPISLYALHCKGPGHLVQCFPGVAEFLDLVAGGYSQFFAAAGGSTQSASPTGCGDETVITFAVADHVSRLVAVLSGGAKLQDQEPVLEQRPGSATCTLRRVHTLARLYHVWCLPLGFWLEVEKEYNTSAQEGRGNKRGAGSISQFFEVSSQGKNWSAALALRVLRHQTSCLRAALRCWCRRVIYGIDLSPLHDVSYHRHLFGCELDNEAEVIEALRRMTDAASCSDAAMWQPFLDDDDGEDSLLGDALVEEEDE